MSLLLEAAWSHHHKRWLVFRVSIQKLCALPNNGRRQSWICQSCDRCMNLSDFFVFCVRMKCACAYIHILSCVLCAITHGTFDRSCAMSCWSKRFKLNTLGWLLNAHNNSQQYRVDIQNCLLGWPLPFNDSSLHSFFHTNYCLLTPLIVHEQLPTPLIYVHRLLPRRLLIIPHRSLFHIYQWLLSPHIFPHRFLHCHAHRKD